jgi:hypothetical protein
MYAAASLWHLASSREISSLVFFKKINKKTRGTSRQRPKRQPLRHLKINKNLCTDRPSSCILSGGASARANHREAQTTKQPSSESAAKSKSRVYCRSLGLSGTGTRTVTSSPESDRRLILRSIGTKPPGRRHSQSWLANHCVLPLFRQRR